VNAIGILLNVNFAWAGFAGATALKAEKFLYL
jgi:hypothetical protein